MQLNILDYLYLPWLVVLSILGFWIFRYFRRLTSEIDRGNIVKLLDRLLKKGLENTKEITAIKKKLVEMEEQGLLHIQKVGLVRFNPFKELGGDHSFSVALLDKLDTGVLITGLHTRERTRVYLKDIKKGKCEHKLSKDEEKALQQAMKKR